MLRKTLVAVATLLVCVAQTSAGEVLHVYGPGGPAPAIKAAARAFSAVEGIEVQVTAGPTSAWSEKFKQDGDLIYSGSEAMMSDFVTQFDGALVASSIEPLYVRPAAILVRPGNPKHIRGFRDLLTPGIGLLVVHGAGQVGLWEDIAGRAGNIRTLQALRHNIQVFAANSAAAKSQWEANPNLDAWIIYGIWAIANPGIAQVVELERRYRLYRDCGLALTPTGQRSPATLHFIEFLKSPEGRKIFVKFGWTDPTHVE